MNVYGCYMKSLLQFTSKMHQDYNHLKEALRIVDIHITNSPLPSTRNSIMRNGSGLNLFHTPGSAHNSGRNLGRTPDMKSRNAEDQGAITPLGKHQNRGTSVMSPVQPKKQLGVNVRNGWSKNPTNKTGSEGPESRIEPPVGMGSLKMHNELAL
mmetsp:Transcript_9784/g.19275  ORF Transcript_9784/g.19275 Transcript_9784/m.19275 type:complete len:154 (-) Transcript_9784:437-898(-)